MNTSKKGGRPAKAADSGPKSQDRRDCGLTPLPLPMAQPETEDIPCCGPKQQPPANRHERPGYALCSFVEDFIDTPVGRIPRVATRLTPTDGLGTLRARLGINRNHYAIAPGLYCVGTPDSTAPVLVTANYKLSFDALRQELADIAAWILVLDTRGINVWCAASKKNFSTAEVIYRVKHCGLDRVVQHRTLILPQLAAPGVSTHKLTKGCGFSGLWGPIRAADLPEFLHQGRKATATMRQITFSLPERLILIPVELALLLKPTAWIVTALFLLSGLDSSLFSWHAAWHRGQEAVLAYLAGVAAGAVATPALLPWLPSRRFAIKGLWTGLAAGLALLFWRHPPALDLGSLALLSLCLATSSYTAMNFTGTTPFTSPSGVEKEMRQTMPLLAVMLLFSVVAWLAAPFIR